MSDFLESFLFTLACIAITAVLIFSSLSFFTSGTNDKNHQSSSNPLTGEVFRISKDPDGVKTVYLSSTIKSKDSYLPLIDWLNSNSNEKLIRIYLSGYGGYASSLVDLINTMRHTKTKEEMVVYGDVYSAHAMLAMNGDYLVVENPNTLFLFHYPATGIDGNYVSMLEACEYSSGTDRGVSAKDKCIEFANALTKSWNETTLRPVFSVLTVKQQLDYYNGHDVIVTGGEILERLSK